jgi:Homeodomain-like domain
MNVTVFMIMSSNCGCVGCRRLRHPEILRRSGKSKPVVWRWQARFMAEGVDGLTRDKTRKPGKQPLPTGTVQRVVDLALGPPP